MRETYIAWNEWWMDLWFDNPILFGFVVTLAIGLAIWRSRLNKKKW